MNTNDWGQSELYLNAHDPCNAHPGPQWATSRFVTRYREHFISVTGRLGPLLWSSSHWQYLEKSTKMLIASHSQLAELARPIFISHFSSYLRIQICGGHIFAQQRSNDVCWHLRDHLMLTMMMLEMTPMIPLMLQWSPQVADDIFG